MLEPLKVSVSVLPWPSTVSLPSPGSQLKRSSPEPSSAVSAPRLPSTTSLPLPPISVSAPAPPSSVSLPAPPSIVTVLSLTAAAEERHLVVAASRGDRDRGEGALVEGEVDRAVGADVDRQLGAVGNEDQTITRAVAGQFQGSGLDLPRVARHRGGRQAERRQGHYGPGQQGLFHYLPNVGRARFIP